jgi:hypothetical protein
MCFDVVVEMYVRILDVMRSGTEECVRRAMHVSIAGTKRSGTNANQLP